MNSLSVVDADGHIMEPPTMWRDYIAPSFKKNCLLIIRDENDGDKLLVNNKPSKMVRRLGVDSIFSERRICKLGCP